MLGACKREQSVAGPITVYKTESCGCCRGWISHMTKAGFSPTIVVVDSLTPLWAKHAIADELTSCHMGEIGGYITIGHVPPDDVKRLLRRRPQAAGLVVKGMPWGSPGMEAPEGDREPYDTLLMLAGGATQVFAHHPV